MIDVKYSSMGDLDEVLSWLKEEYDQTDDGTGFWCNRDLIRRAHKESRMWVGCDSKSHEVVAFQIGGLLSPGILEVRPDRRGQGCGRQMVDHCVQQARLDDVCLLYIECKPSASIPFWKSMGFQLLTEAFADREYDLRGNYAYRILGKAHDIPKNSGDHVKVEINFHTQGGFKLNQYKGIGCRQKDGTILLPERVVSYCPMQVFRLADTLVNIAVEGESVCVCKAKYSDAEAAGVIKVNSELFYIDELLIQVDVPPIAIRDQR